MAKNFDTQLKKLQNTIYKKTQSIIQPSDKLICMNVHKLKDLQTCDRMYFWKWIMNLEPNKMSLPFWFGSMVHYAMEWYVQGKSIAFIHKGMDKESKKFMSRYALMPENAEEIALQLQIAKIIVKTYINMFGKNQKDHKTIAVEEKFRFQLERSPVWLLGTMDWRGEFKKSRAIKEYKTAAMINSEYFSKLVFDKQLNGYALGHKALTGKYPQKCPYTVFRKPSIRCRQNETPKQFLTRFEEDLHVRADWYFLQEVITFTKQMIENTKNDIEYKVADLYYKYERLSTEEILNPQCWSRNDHSCFNYGLCKYFSLCKDAKSFKTYLPFYQMREIRYDDEKKELGEIIEVKAGSKSSAIKSGKSKVSPTKKATPKKKKSKKVTKKKTYKRKGKK